MDDKEDNINLQTYNINKNTYFDPEETIHVLTPRDSYDQSQKDFAPSSKIETPTKTKFYKILNGSPIIKSTNKKKINLQSVSSLPQKRHIEFNSPTNNAAIVQSSPKSDLSPSRHGPSQLRISGQKIVEESISLIRPMKCCNYEVPDIISPSPINTHKSSFRSNVTATRTIMRRQQLQEQNMHKIRMMQQNMMINYKNHDRSMSQDEMKQIKKGIDRLERQQKMAEEAKKKEKNLEIQNPNFVNLLPTVML